MEDFLNLPKVSFIVITHNFSKFVCDCLNSIKNQTYKNFEIIVVDDCSEDNTVKIIEEFISNNKSFEISFIKNEKNLGQFSSFIIGLKQANGQFICAIDGDDVLFPDYAAIHIEAHLKTPVALTSCYQAEIDSNNIIHSLCSNESPVVKDKLLHIENKSFEDFMEYRCANGINKQGCDLKVLDNDKYSFATWHWSPASSGMMRKSVCDLLLQMDCTKELKITADKFLFSFCHLIGSSAIIEKVLYAYRRHDSNYSMANPVMGNKKYFKAKTQNNYYRNNKKIRGCMFNYIYQNRKFIVEKLNKINLLLIYKRILFSFDRKFFKGLIKSLFR